MVIVMLLPRAGEAEPLSRIVTGDVIANRTVTLATRIMGRVTMVHAEEGDRIKAGQVIVELDDTEYQAKLRSAEAALEKMQVERAHRKRIKGRLAKLAKKNATSEEAMDEAEYAFQLAQSNLKAGQAEIDGIKATLAETRITVPFDAVVIRKFAEMQARITITALGNETVTGKVVTIIPAGDERHTFVVELELPKKPGLYPGMFGKAVFN